MPVMLPNRALGLLEAGLRRAPGCLPDGIPVYAEPQLSGIRLPENLAVATAGEIELLHEGLAQLAARLREWYESGHDALAGNEEIPRAQQIINFIQRESHRPLTLGQLAEHLHLSRDRTAHIVAAETGRNFKELVTEARIGIAKSLLWYTALPLAEIAARCGFVELSHFHKVFRKNTGMTPAEFRKSPHNNKI